MLKLFEKGNMTESDEKKTYKIQSPWMIFGIILLFIILSEFWASTADSLLKVLNRGVDLSWKQLLLVSVLATFGFIILIRALGISYVSFEKSTF